MHISKIQRFSCNKSSLPDLKSKHVRQEIVSELGRDSASVMGRQTQCLNSILHVRRHVKQANFNRPFPSSLVPQFQSESKSEIIVMKMTLICMKMKLHAELIFIRNVSHLDSF